jgi:hypothetical protein
MFAGNTVLWLAHMENNEGKVFCDRNFANTVAAEIYEFRYGEKPEFSIRKGGRYDRD